MEEEIRVGEKVGEGDNAETLLADIMEVDGSVREKMVLKKRFKAMSLVDTIKRLQVQKQVEEIGDPRIITETGIVWIPGDQVIDLQSTLQTRVPDGMVTLEVIHQDGDKEREAEVLTEAREIMAKVHAAGIGHGDLSYFNVMAAKEAKGDVRIIDWDDAQKRPDAAKWEPTQKGKRSVFAGIKK